MKSQMSKVRSAVKKHLPLVKQLALALWSVFGPEVAKMLVEVTKHALFSTNGC